MKENIGKDSWAVRKLRDRLDTLAIQGWTKKGRVRVSKKMDTFTLKKTIKAVNQFLNSKTSKISGIKEVIEIQKKNIRERFEDDEFYITDEESEMFYEMFGQDSTQYFIDRIGASEFMLAIEESINYTEHELDKWNDIPEDERELNDDEKIEQLFDDFIRHISNGYLTIDYNDREIINRLRIIFERYILK